MSDLYWLTDEQMARLQPYCPKSHSYSQVRLMNVAGEAQTLAAALHHAAFNVANALGPWLAGFAISAGCGWSSAGPVGSVLAIGGLILLAAALHRRRSACNGGLNLYAIPHKNL